MKQLRCALPPRPRFRRFVAPFECLMHSLLRRVHALGNRPQVVWRFPSASAHPRHSKTVPRSPDSPKGADVDAWFTCPAWSARAHSILEFARKLELCRGPGSNWRHMVLQTMRLRSSRVIIDACCCQRCCQTVVTAGSDTKSPMFSGGDGGNRTRDRGFAESRRAFHRVPLRSIQADSCRCVPLRPVPFRAVVVKWLSAEFSFRLIGGVAHPLLRRLRREDSLSLGDASRRPCVATVGTAISNSSYSLESQSGTTHRE